MKKIIFIMMGFVILVSCSTQKEMVIPRVVSTIGTATFENLNLQRNDYQIMKTITAEATVSYETNKSGTNIRISGVDDDFKLEYTKDKKEGWQCKYKGILKYGYIQNDFPKSQTNVASPEEIVYRLAIYRLVSQVKSMGGDGLVAPSVVTRIEQKGDVVYFYATAEAKSVKLVTN